MVVTFQQESPSKSDLNDVGGTYHNEEHAAQLEVGVLTCDDFVIYKQGPPPLYKQLSPDFIGQAVVLHQSVTRTFTV